MLTDNLSVLEFIDVHGRYTDFLASGGHAHQWLRLCACHRVTHQNLVTFRNGFLYLPPIFHLISGIAPRIIASTPI